jgi:apolipoprotein D and lipocalin family protein
VTPLRAGIVVVLAATVAACAVPRTPAGTSLATVDKLDLARYEGRWYEVARLPNRFQAQCAGDVTATYARRSDGTIDVANACRRADGATETAQGVARVVDPSTNAKLEVRFAPAALSWLPWVWGDYWVLALDPGYGYALVGEPARDYLWVLSRTPTLPADDYARLLDVARRAGYDTDRVQRTLHTGSSPS